MGRYQFINPITRGRRDDPYDPAAPNDYVEIQKRNKLLGPWSDENDNGSTPPDGEEQERLAEERRDLPRPRRATPRLAFMGAAWAAVGWRLEPAGVDEGRGDGGGGGEASPRRRRRRPRKSKPTRVLQLHLGDADDFEQLREEIASECGKYARWTRPMLSAH